MGIEPMPWLGAAAGAAVGVASTCVLWISDLWLSGAGYGPSGLVEIHLANPIHWVTDLLPFGLAWAGWAIASLRIGGALPEASHDPWADAHLSERLLDAAFLVDPGGMVIEANQSAEVIFGYSTNAMRGLPLRVILPDHDDQEHSRSREVESPSMEVLGVQWEMRASRADGVNFDALVMVSPTSQRRFIYVVSPRYGRANDDGTVPQSWVVERKGLISERDQAIETNKAKSHHRLQ